MLARHEVLTVLLIIFGLMVFALALSICAPAIARRGFEDEDEDEEGDLDRGRTASFSSSPTP